MKSEIRDLFKFLDNARSIYHVADYARKYLIENSFEDFKVAAFMRPLIPFYAAITILFSRIPAGKYPHISAGKQ